MPAVSALELRDGQGNVLEAEVLEAEVLGEEGKGPLFIWLISQYGHAEEPRAIGAALVLRGAEVWLVDLLDSLLMERTSDNVRNLEGEPVLALIEAAQRAVEGTSRPVVLVACDRMAAPALRGMRLWQARGVASSRLAGAVLFFPNLYRGNPVAGEDPELIGIARATNMPVFVMQPELGTQRWRFAELLDALHAGGSAAWGWFLPQVRDFFYLHFEQPTPSEEQMTTQIPQRLFTAARLLAAAPHPSVPAPLDGAADKAKGATSGLVMRKAPVEAPGFDLIDTRNRRLRLEDYRGKVLLVNFWATWCPPCVHEIPSMNRLAAEYNPGRFEIVSINFKEDAEHMRGFLKKVAVDFPVLLDPQGQAARQWKVFAFPSSFLVDAQGRIRYSVNSAIAWDTDEVRQVVDGLIENTP